MAGKFSDPYHSADAEVQSAARKLEAKADGWSRLADAARERFRVEPTAENETAMRLADARARESAMEALAAWDAIARKNVT